MWDKNVDFWQTRKAVERRRSYVYFAIGAPIGAVLGAGSMIAPWPWRALFIEGEFAVVVALFILARRAGAFTKARARRP